MLWLLACQNPTLELLVEDSTESSVDSPVESQRVWPALRINEAQSANRGTLVDDDGSTPDWVELYNDAPETVDLAGWTLNDMPLEGELAPGGIALLSELDFGIDREGDELILHAPDGQELHRVDVPALREDHSYGRAQSVQTVVLVDEHASMRWSLDAEEGWNALDADDSGWDEGTQALGHDGVDPDAVAEDVAPGQPAWQSTDGFGRTGPEAVDGSISTFTHTNTGDFEPWWRVDLGQAVRVDSVVLFNRVGCCPERLYNITVEALGPEDEVLWTSPVLNETDTPVDPGETLEVSLEEGVDATGIRVRKEAVGGNYESEWLTLAEVEVWARPASPYGDRIQTPLDAAPDEAWMRIPFTFTGQLPDRLVLEVFADDAADAWLNGSPVLPGALDPTLLIEGDNLLALHGTNADEAFLLQATLVAETVESGGLVYFDAPTPGAVNGEGFDGYVADPVPDQPRGFYTDTTTVVLATETEGATLVYTLDGSEPGPDNGTQVDQSVTLEVETTALVRAWAFKEGLYPSDVVTHSYLFLEDVVRQSAAPDGLPTTWAGQGQTAVSGDYEMDPEVVDASLDELLEGLRDIPTLSIVTDHEDLFGEGGLYINSTQRGPSWEREASVELLLPDGTTGFQEQTGIRIHGYGWRPHTNTRKHSIRLEFRAEYGKTKLDWPLFEDAPVDRFDSIVLRAQGSRGWQDFRDPEQAQYLRDTFARDTAYDMGKQEGHATYVHLYLNGLYWGLYNPVERPDADFGAERFGGEKDDYDAINRRTTTNEAIDGTLDAYNALLALADGDISADMSAIEDVLDVDDLVDYMLIHQYTANRDGPELFNSNNMRGVRNREGGLWRWFVWDMEYSVWYATDDINVDVDVAGSISHVYARLRTNADFRVRYAARAHGHLTGNGALTPNACIARYEARAAEIERAILGESARWGDTDRAVPYTRDVEWEAERQRLLTEFFPQRTAVLIEQLTAAGLY
jgi:hypothetical protein